MIEGGNGRRRRENVGHFTAEDDDDVAASAFAARWGRLPAGFARRPPSPHWRAERARRTT